MTSLDGKIYQRIFGRPSTRPPGNHLCWKFRDGTIRVDLKLAVELFKNDSAIYLFDKSIGEKIIVARDDRGEFHVFRGRCRHKEKNDPDSAYLSTCCSVDVGTRGRDGEKQITVIPNDCVHRYDFKVDGVQILIFL